MFLLQKKLVILKNIVSRKMTMLHNALIAKGWTYRRNMWYKNKNQVILTSSLTEEENPSETLLIFTH